MKPRSILPLMRRLSSDAALDCLRHKLVPLGLTLAVLALAGCAMMESQGEKPLTAEIPAAAPRTLGVETLSSAEHKKMIAQFGGEYHYPSAERFLNDILVKLAKSGSAPTDPYKVTILNSPDRQCLRAAAGQDLCDARPA